VPAGKPRYPEPPLETRADRLDSWKEIAAHLARSVPTVQRWEKKEGLPVHRHAHEAQASVYAYKSELDRWWQERGAGLRPKGGQRLRRMLSAVVDAPGFLRGRIGRRVWMAAAAIVLAAGAIARWELLAANRRWGHEALPEIERLASVDAPYYWSGDDSVYRAYRLAIEARRYIPRDARLAEVWSTISRPIEITTEPPGADIYISTSSGGQPLHLGRSPLSSVRIPVGFLRWRAAKEGYEAAEGLIGQQSDSLHVVLDSAGSSPPGMVRAPGGTFELGLAHLGSQPSFELGDYWIDRYEVTNREFKRFVDASGYSDPKYWMEPFVKDGQPLSFAEAMPLFRDRTGRPGPASWEAGDFPDGQGDLPVTGISWYEAAAYAKFMGESLPTIFHWTRAAGTFSTSAIVPLSNFSGRGLSPAGQYHGLSAVGAYDMAGNAKEWCLNTTGDERFALGGAWNEPSYLFSEVDARPPFSRAANLGFRLMRPIAPVDLSLNGPVEYPRRDFAKEKPAGDAAFVLLRGRFSYDKSPLHAKVEPAPAQSEHWREEKVSFDAAYAGERVSAYLFLPRHAPPPYQTVVYFPGSSGILLRASVDLRPPLNGAIVKSGRAFVFPIYKSTYERGDALNTDYPAETDFYREHVIEWYKDLARTLDYVETRADLDSSRLAYYGFSWGARLGPLFLAIEPRLKTGILVAGGLKFARALPEADPFNFASRVTVPVLMVNGRYDYYFPLETSQEPLLRLLGAPPRDKRHVVLDCGHAPPDAAVAREVLDWLDRYLGPVGSPAGPGEPHAPLDDVSGGSRPGEDALE
jgi:formylglycine-generating enzyme required for sulfatase activity/predicted esterase